MGLRWCAPAEEAWWPAILLAYKKGTKFEITSPPNRTQSLRRITAFRTDQKSTTILSGGVRAT